MITKEKISPLQLGILIVGFNLGDAVLVSPAKGAFQDSWLSIIIAWMGSYFLVGTYVYISRLYPNMTLIEILKSAFGKIMGTFIGILYVWYFIHISALVYRSFGEYIVTVNYPETPRIFISIVLMLITVYALKSGLEVIGRTGELTFVLIPVTIALLSVLLIEFMDIKNLQPFLERGVTPVIKTSFALLTFPFGESIVFMMLFPFLNDSKKIWKTTYISLTLAGFLLFYITLRNMMILGPNMIGSVLFPGHLVASLLPGAVLDPFLSITLLTLGGFQSLVCAYAAILGITQLANLDDYKPIVFPVMIIIVSLSNWLYKDITSMIRVAKDIYPFYAIPFQMLIPAILLIVSVIKQRKSTAKKKPN
ncbi:GerAB/ArcD/ProY family transporter [Anaerosolibacter sp.]|uniref:GerAB/ArcD/ProY family transporter n=1 Tax=Anaerosolibacter sp. TaxID=1872527 RepID=UPI0039EF0E6E